ncbi:DNA-binding GntR family transcriptional regulator [Dyadobacter jejuensis]|uniref:DNA-binding GntR family transcriptional regulator n=1 Tax=Dyadobacter jejuensis TaxID=1082580 RepID=A0A316B2U4_9BACT|nr:GntR family transcriptional regulator [Dyadobacter jejuensis]PWJ56867.1 DNA-binding GntR family transcriptional regulator [Dyadobacter jejuensis]
MISHTDLSQLAYLELKRQILEGELEKGEKLVQERIAEQLGVSRMPLHKAFQMLESEFLVEAIPRRGYFVKKFEFQELIDAFECREVLEGLAARRLALQDDHRQIAQELFDIFQPFVHQKEVDVEAYRIADQLFHNMVRQKSDNVVLKKLDALGNYLKMTFSLGLVRTPEQTLPEHLSIIEAIRKGDGTGAEELIKAHARKTIQILVNKNA